MLNDINELMKTMNDEVPVLVRKRTEEIRDLDNKVSKSWSEIHVKTYAHVKNLKTFNREQKSKTYAELLKKFDEIEEYSEKKVQLARSMYDSIDDYIKQMDETDRKFREQRAKTSKKAEEKLASMPSPIKKDGKHRKDKKKSIGADIKASRMAESESFMKHVPVIPPLNENAEMPIDPNEPTYCFCHSVSFGQMIACDNKDCPTEWFHFTCVGLTETPPGLWYCDSCRPSMPKKKR